MTAKIAENDARTSQVDQFVVVIARPRPRQENFCRGYLANRMWFSVVCNLKDNDTRHHCGQNVVDPRGVISHNIKDKETNLCQDFLTNQNTDSDLKVRARHYANELLVRVRLSFQKPWKTFANSLNMQKKYEKMSRKIAMTRTCCR